MKRRTIANALAISAVAALSLGIAPAVNAEGLRCTNATIKGAFAHTGTGTIFLPDGTTVQLANVGTETFDGKGGLTAKGYASQNGNGIAETHSGTYTVNPDCTGTYTVYFPALNITSAAYFVIADSGKELQVISTDPGVVLTGIARRQFAIGDGR